MCVKRLFLIASLAASSLLPSVSAAQTWDEPWSDPRDRPPRVDISVTAGMLMPSDWSDLVVLGTLSPVTGVFEQVVVRDVRVEPDSAFGAEVTYWRDRYGFRASAALSRSELTIGGGPDIDRREVLSNDVNTWFYGVRGVIGLVEYSPTRKAWPYVFLGGGGITYDLERTLSPPLLTFIEGGPQFPPGPGPIVVVDDDAGREFVLAVDELGLETQFAFDFGIGTDLRLPFGGGGGIGLRLEVSDQIARSPLGVRIRELSPAGGLTRDDEVSFGTVHHLRAVAGIVVQIGR